MRLHENNLKYRNNLFSNEPNDRKRDGEEITRHIKKKLF